MKIISLKHYPAYLYSDDEIITKQKERKCNIVTYMNKKKQKVRQFDGRM